VFASLAMEHAQNPQLVSNIGIHAIEVRCHSDNRDSVAFEVVSSLINQYKIDPRQIGKFEISAQGSGFAIDKEALLGLFGDTIVINVSNDDSADILFNAMSWIEGDAWDGRDVIAIFVEDSVVIAVVIGPNAPIILQPVRGVHTERADNVDPLSSYSTALSKATQAFKENESAYLGKAGSDAFIAAEFDYLIVDTQDNLTFMLLSSQPPPDKSPLSPSLKPLHSYLPPSLSLAKRTGATSVFAGVASIVGAIPSYDLFEKRIAVFSHNPESSSSFFALRVVKDTKYIRDTMRLSSRTDIPANCLRLPKYHRPCR